MSERNTKLLLVGSSLLNSLLFSGIIFGWGPLQVMLQGEGQFHEDCGSHSSKVCPEQAAQFATIFSTATFLVNGISLPSGHFLDKFGGRAVSATAMVFNVCGLVLVGMSDSIEFNYFILGYALIAVGGQMTLFSVFPTAFEVPEYQTLVFATNSCFFDGSCIVFQVLLSLHNWFGYSRQSLFFGYALFSIPLYMINIYLWRYGGDGDNDGDTSESDTEGVGSMVKANLSSSPHFSPKPPRRSPSQHNETTHLTIAQNTASTKDLGLFEQLQTWDFFFILMFASIGILRANLYIGVNVQLLNNLGDSDPENNYFYSTLFGYLLPLGFLFIPAIDAAVARSMNCALHTTNFLAIAVSILMLIPSLNVQVANFLIFAGFRAFLYGVMGAFIGETFGPITLGRITGCVFTTGSLANLIQAPIINSVNFYFGGDTTVLATGLLIVGAAMIIPISFSKDPNGSAQSHEVNKKNTYVEVEASAQL
jgi:LAT3 family solute carrier family 43 protein 3